MNHGMHTDMPIADFGETGVQRCRKAWWTVYVLGRQMTSLMGLPQSTLDEEVYCQLPSFSGSQNRRAAAGMQIRFARIISSGKTAFLTPRTLADHPSSGLWDTSPSEQGVCGQYQGCFGEHRRNS